MLHLGITESRISFFICRNVYFFAVVNFFIGVDTIFTYFVEYVYSQLSIEEKKLNRLKKCLCG